MKTYEDNLEMQNDELKEKILHLKGQLNAVDESNLFYQKEIKVLKDKLHRRNMQIKDLKTTQARFIEYLQNATTLNDAEIMKLQRGLGIGRLGVEQFFNR